MPAAVDTEMATDIGLVMTALRYARTGPGKAAAFRVENSCVNRRIACHLSSLPFALIPRANHAPETLLCQPHLRRALPESS